MAGGLWRFYRKQHPLNVRVPGVLACIFVGKTLFLVALGSDDANARAAQLKRMENETYSLEAIWWKHIPHIINRTLHLYYISPACYTHKQQVFFCNCEGKLELLQCVYMNWLLTNYVSWWARRGLCHFVFACVWRGWVWVYYILSCLLMYVCRTCNAFGNSQLSL